RARRRELENGSLGLAGAPVGIRRAAFDRRLADGGAFLGRIYRQRRIGGRAALLGLIGLSALFGRLLGFIVGLGLVAPQRRRLFQRAALAATGQGEGGH